MVQRSFTSWMHNWNRTWLRKVWHAKSLTSSMDVASVASPSDWPDAGYGWRLTQALPELEEMAVQYHLIPRAEKSRRLKAQHAIVALLVRHELVTIETVQKVFSPKEAA